MMMSRSETSVRTEYEISEALYSARLALDAVTFTLGTARLADMPYVARGARLAMAQMRVSLLTLLATGGLPMHCRRMVMASLTSVEESVSCEAIKLMLTETPFVPSLVPSEKP